MGKTIDLWPNSAGCVNWDERLIGIGVGALVLSFECWRFRSFGNIFDLNKTTAYVLSATLTHHPLSYIYFIIKFGSQYCNMI